MFAIEAFFGAVFCRCKSRQEQLILVGLMAVLSLIAAATGRWFVGFAGAARQSSEEVSSGRMDGDLVKMSILSYGIAGIILLLAALFGFMALLNLVRFLTGTGLSDPDDGWS